MITNYPLIIRGPTANARVHLRYFKAETYVQAVDKACEKFPNKFVNYSNAKRMDLQSAKMLAVKTSGQKREQRFYIVETRNGEFEVRPEPAKKPGGNWAVYKNGSEIQLTKEEDDELNYGKRRITKEGKAVTTQPAEQKKASKHLSTQQSAAAANADTMAKKGAAVKAKETTAKKVDISIKDMRANLKKGFVYRDPQGVKQTEKYMATRKNQDHVREGMLESKAVKA
jgi:hypothetical protein